MLMFELLLCSVVVMPRRKQLRRDQVLAVLRNIEENISECDDSETEYNNDISWTEFERTKLDSRDSISHDEDSSENDTFGIDPF